MAPTQDSSGSNGNSWDSSTTIELVALTLTIPGAIAALATLWILLARRRKRKRSQPNNTTATTTTHDNTFQPARNSQGVSTSNNASFDWFQEHYDDLHGEVTAETHQWAEEMAYLTGRS